MGTLRHFVEFISFHAEMDLVIGLGQFFYSFFRHFFSGHFCDVKKPCFDAEMDLEIGSPPLKQRLIETQSTNIHS